MCGPLQTLYMWSALTRSGPSLTNESPLIQSEPSEPCHKKPCYSVGLIFKLGPCPQSLPAVYCCWISGQPYLLLWQLCLFLSKLFSLSITVCTICPFSLSLSVLLSLCICWLEYWCCQLLPCNDFSLFFFCFPGFFLFVFFLTFNLFLFFALSVYFLQCDQVQVIPIPSVCIIIFHFSSPHSITIMSSLCSLRFIILAACGCWHKGDFSLLSDEIFAPFYVFKAWLCAA